MKKNRER